MSTTWGFASTNGLAFTEASIVDEHFAACREPYLELLRDVGIRPGWRVLDAGCGSGSFLPALAELVGEHGKVSGIDLAEENVALAARRSPAEVRQGTVLDLPYPDASFDAVWCANTTQYLDDDELARALAELSRVVRHGGVVAVKDLDATLVTVRPGDPFQFADFFRLAARTYGYARQLSRGRELRRWVERAGLADVRQRTVLIEHRAPFSVAAQRFYRRSCARLAEQAIAAGAPGDWQRFVDPDRAGHPFDDPRAYLSEGNVLAVGVVDRAGVMRRLVAATDVADADIGSPHA